MQKNYVQQRRLWYDRNNPKKVSYPEACGQRHLAFYVEDMDAAIKELNKKGIQTELARNDEFTGKRITFPVTRIDSR
ncbi:VOC family protein [Muricomes intestini]|uniref:VOC family protein n=1 Tax=Muricomes intestini TaxID=1796634 RepID=UPI001A9B7564|nr:VOC family protein [Muricomes intestini]